MKIAVGSDHGGFALKEAVKKHLEAKGIEVEDFGCYSTESVDYAVYGAKVAHCVADGKADYGVLVCSTGIGISMAANKVKGIRAALCSDTHAAEMTRRHNNANILCLGGLVTEEKTALEIVLSKAADVITYVEHGVCDMGVVGKDTIMEKGGSFYEMVDLGFGKCRFALATKKGKDVYGGYKTPVIATKYPAVTKAFFNKKNMDVETIKIEGSVELAPLLELADGIVDIVETGTTLKENGLEVVENVAPISARVIVNLASAKMKKAAIQKVIAELENGLNN